MKRKKNLRRIKIGKRKENEEEDDNNNNNKKDPKTKRKSDVNDKKKRQKQEREATIIIRKRETEKTSRENTGSAWSIYPFHRQPRQPSRGQSADTDTSLCGRTNSLAQR